MKSKGLKVLSVSLLMSTLLISGCGCSKEYKINFIGNNGTTIKKVKEGNSLTKDQIPQPPKEKGKYCLWDIDKFENINSDIDVNYTCYDSVNKLETNLPTSITPMVSSKEANIDYILKNLVVIATLQDGTIKTLYKDDVIIDTSKYDKDLSGKQFISITYNNKSIDVEINVKKYSNYVSVNLESTVAYINEGLPNIYANTDIPGKISFDDGQELKLGNCEYSWTFLPDDLNKYDIVKGVNEVNMINASKIETNKDDFSFVFDYATSKADIIKEISNGLIVKGTFGKIQRIIPSQYYTIESDYLIDQPGKEIKFVINYGQGGYKVSKNIIVQVKKNNNYNIKFNKIPTIVIDNKSDINYIFDIAKDYFVSDGIDGDLIFDYNQELKLGSQTYTYKFVPKYNYYAIKTGIVRINTKKLSDIQLDDSYHPSYAYDSMTLEDIQKDILNNFKGYLIFSDESRELINNNNITIEIKNYNSKIGGEYEYIVTYNNLIKKTFKFEVRKIDFVLNEDYSVKLEKQFQDYNKFPLISLNSLKPDFDSNKFNVVSLKYENINNTNSYIYTYEAIPIGEANNKYNTFIIEVKIDY